MSNRYTPVRTTMDTEDNYNSPFDHHDIDSDAHYEAPSCLKRNPSGSLFIPSSVNDTENTLPLESRIKHSAYSPHHTLRSYSPPDSSKVSSRHENAYTNSTSVYNVGSLGTRLGNTLLSRGGVSGGMGGAGGPHSPTRSPNTEKFTNLDSHRTTLPNYGSSGQLTVYPHPGAHVFHNGTSKRPNSSSQSSQSFRLKSDLSSRCSWKFLAIFFILFSFLLVSALVYTAASNIVLQSSTSLEKAQACPVIEDSQDKNFVPKSGLEYEKEYKKEREEATKGVTFQGFPDLNTFKDLRLDAKLAHIIQPYTFWNLKVQQMDSVYVQFDFNLPRGASIGLYARRNAIPTFTNNDVRDVLKGFREKRSTNIHRNYNYYFESGHWFISLYNDDSEPREIEMSVSVREDLTAGCPRGCSKHGECIGGQCVCQTGFHGADCSESSCPVLCNGNGEYVNGVCKCFPGWKGVECSVRHNECEVADCNNRGDCQNGECVCSRGYTGKFCQEVDCADPTCSGHGSCLHGQCHCIPGYTGSTCARREVDQNCPQTCSSRGMFDIQLGVCRCDPGFYGEDCSKERCEIDCGDHGECSGKACVCSEGWSGPLCNVKLCDTRCSAHGMCSNGTCLCTNGWNGKHCTLEGCPGNCNGHGTCSTNYELEWECMCETGWYGPACNIQLEASCDDRLDNDQDGLVDCEDPECCESPVCERSQLCHTVSSPIDILLRKQPPSITAPFYERMKFIIEDNGLQSYAQKVGFNESRAAVVRGQVITPSGMGLIGVRVSTNGVNEGFTMTRDDGWFDLMVNGGGPVMLQFGRNPYSPLRLSLYVPWNEVVVLSPVQLGRTEMHVQVPALYSSIPTCTPHDYNRMQPTILSSWHTNYRGGTGSSGAVLAESRILRESLTIPGSGIKLVYISSRAKGFYSTLQLQLTPEGDIPPTLVRVHLTISIEGVLDQKVFEADPLLQYTYAWDRLNVYRQRVYGVTTANIKVGYEYTGCEMVWIAKTAKVAGHDMTLSDIGGWNLDVQHKYNYHEGILQKGDGSNLYLKYTPLVVTTLVGNGQPRPAECGKGGALCDGKAATQSLLAPKSLTVGPDGSVYVADFDLIRKISTDGEVRTVKKLNGTRVGYRYHLAHRVYTRELEHRQALYISMPHKYQIITLKDLNGEGFNEDTRGSNIGNGERCLPGDPDNCGDGGKAEAARLTYPKGIAIGPDGKVYFADGNNIRMVDENGVMHTVVGHQKHRAANWKPMACDTAVPVGDVQLNWPTDLAINPLDGTLHFIDDNMVMQLTNDGRIKIVAGRPLHCPPPTASTQSPSSQDDPQSSGLLEPQSISFSANGELYIAESDGKRINRVRRLVHNTIEIIAGTTACNCMDPGCNCYDPDSYLASSTPFSAISSLAVSPDGKIYVADEGNLRIRAIASQMPTKEEDEVFEVPDPGSQELYIFNRYSQHILTKDLLTKSLIYSMEYSQATSTGKLVSVTDASGRKLAIVRDYSNQITALQTSNGDKHELKINRMGYLEKFATPSGYNVEFHYMSSTGLLESKLDAQNYAYVYKYDDYGRLIQSIAPTGEITFLDFNLTSSGGNINVGSQVVSIKENRVVKRSAGNEGPVRETVFLPDKSLQVNLGPRTVTMKMIPHPVISHSQPVIGGSYPMIGKVNIETGSALVSQLEWFYNLQTSGHDKQLLGITKMLQVNKENLLVVSFDKLQSREVLYLPDRTQLLEIKYDEASRPITWAPSKGSFAPTVQRYDRFGLLEHWQRGDTEENYSYDKNGRLVTIQHSNSTYLAFTYNDRDTLPSKVSTGNGASYLMDYDSTTGSVKSVTTPRGHIHTWRLQPHIDAITWLYSPPWTSQPIRVMFNSRGSINSVKLSGNGQVSYVYSADGSIQHLFAGRTEIEWSMDPLIGAPESVYLTQPGLDLREKRKYHNGILKEQKFRFGGNSNFENTFIKYQCDGVGRPARVGLTTGSKRERNAPDLTWTYNQNTGELEAIDNFQVSRIGYTRTEIKEKTGSFMKTIDLDILGNIKRILYSVKRQKIFELKFEYNNENYLLHTAVSDESGRDTKTSYAYTLDGQLDKSWGTINYDYSYDENGNMLMQSRDTRRTNIAYGPGDRVETFAGNKVTYDADGFVTVIDQEKYLFNALGQLIEYISSRETKVNYYYDSNGRLMGWTDSTGESAQYFYTNPMKPYQVTYAQTNRLGGSIQKLTYDTNDHLIQLESIENGVMYVVCDQFGSPLLVFQPNGNIVKRMSYSPFGEVTEDSKPSVFIPIGFQGMLSSRHGQFMIKQNSQVYSTQINQWLNPDFTKLIKEIDHPSDLFIYRFFNNNPVNPNGRNYMTDINSWASLYGFNIDNIFHGVSQSLDAEPITLLKHKIDVENVIPENGVQFETDDLVSSAVNKVKDLSFIHPIKSVVESRRRNIVPRFSSLPPNFGRGFLLSLVGDENLAVVSSVEVHNSVVQNIFESVLNNSIYLDVSFSDTSKSVYYFVKPNMNKFSLDSDTVRRLAGEFSVAHKEIEHGGKELSIVNSKFEVRILYGAAPDVYRTELLKTFASLAVSRAWTIEKEVVTRGFTGSNAWTPSEISELLRTGKVRGYEATEVQPVDKFPSLALDGTNREFNKVGQQGRGRKNRHGRRKHAQDY